MTVSIEQAQISLAELIAGLSQDERVVITQNQEPIAELRSVTKLLPTPKFGSCRGMLTIVSEDDDHLADFKEYMP